MSDTPVGPGWWKASDDKWYPPEQHPDYQPPANAAEQPAEPAETPADPAPTEPPAEPTAPVEQPAEPTAPAAEVPPPAPATPAADVPPPAPATPAAQVPPPAPVTAAGDVPPPGAPPPAAPTTGDGDGEGKGGSTKVIVGIVAVIALIAGAFVVITQLGDDEAAAASVSLESIGSEGPNPFFASIAPQPSGSLMAFAEQGAPSDDEVTDDEPARDDVSDPDEQVQVGYRTVDGSVAGLYGGTLNEASCDPDQLAGLLAAEEDKAQAWADVLEIDPADIDAYIDRLTPVNLGSDTRVVNHGFRDGEATPRQAILQRGSAVLVDSVGVPRVNCYSGAPLRQPQAIEGDEEYSGDEWDAFEPDEVAVVDDAPSELDSFDLRDVETGELFNRPVGSRGESDGASRSRPATQERQVDGPIELDRTYDDSLEDDRTEARYTFDAPDSAVLTVRVANDGDSVRRVRAQVDSGSSSYINQSIQPGDVMEERVVLDHEGGGPFEIRFSEGPAAYTFEISLDLQDDAGQGGDAGDSFETAFEISSGDAVEGLLGGDDNTDMYLLELEEGSGGLLTIEFENDRDSTRRAQLVVEFEGSTISSSRTQPNAEQTVSHLFDGEQSGFVEITVNEGPADYRFTVTLEPQDDAGLGGDAPDSLADAWEVPVGEELTGQVGNDDSGDYYLFTHPGTDLVISFTVSAESDRRVRIEISDPAGSRVGGGRINPGASEEFTVGPDQQGSTYRIRIDEGRGDYTFSIQSASSGAGD